jgi:hypothetical protein
VGIETKGVRESYIIYLGFECGPIFTYLVPWNCGLESNYPIFQQ